MSGSWSKGCGEGDKVRLFLGSLPEMGAGWNKEK